MRPVPGAELRLVEDRTYDGYWFMNKTHLAFLEDDALLFLDTDTIVRGDLSRIWRDRDNAEVAGRMASSMKLPSWRNERWYSVLDEAGARRFFPYLNTGVVLFQKGAHRRLGHLWMEALRSFWQNNPFANRAHTEQQAFSIAAAQAGLTFSLLSRREHGYAWERDPANGSLVFHTGTPRFKRYALRIAPLALARASVTRRGRDLINADLNEHSLN